MGEVANLILKDSYYVIAFCDNNPEKWGKKISDIVIISPDWLNEENFRNIKIIITSTYYDEIYEQLKIKNRENIMIFSMDLSHNIEEAKEKINLEKNHGVKRVEKNDALLEKEKKENLQLGYLKKLLGSIEVGEKKLYLHMMFDNFYTKTFIEFINTNFKSEEHKFLIIVNESIEIRYVSEVKHFENVEICYSNEKYTGLIFQSYINKAPKVFIHYLTDYVCKLINDFDIPKDCKLNWILWGADLYSCIDRELYCKETKEFLKNNFNDTFISSDYKKNSNYEYRKNAIKKMDTILTNCEGDYTILKENYETNSVRREFIYPNPIDFENLDKIASNNFGVEEKYNFKGKYKQVIQIGNSGDPSNNHIDILYKLKEIKKQDFCIVCPLSYGNYKYIKSLIAFGKELFGERFIPLTDFLSPNVYYKILQEVDIAIMNHRRQQGVGNILVLSYLNKNLFINNSNPFKAELTKLNIPTYDTDDLNRIDLATINNIKNTKEIVKDYYDKNKCIKLWKEVFI